MIRFLEQVDPEGAKEARRRYGCFDHFGDEGQAYGYATAFGIAQPCQDEVVNQLTELRGRMSGSDDFFDAEQNARLIKNAEAYYRSMFGGRVSSWNLRDTHMAETLDAVVAHLRRQGEEPKVVVWEHNSHLGDASATEMGQQGEINAGQLVRRRYGDAAVLVGFSTDRGTVTAADDWDAPAQRKSVRPGLPGSFEELFHEVGGDFYLLLRDDALLAQELMEPRLQRAIGVVYSPETERMSHYFHAQLPRQFDAIIHFDETRAVEPLEQTPTWHGGEPPETYPSGL